MRKLILSLFTALLLLSGCKTKEVVKYVNTESVRDSIVTVTVRDTVLKYLPQKNEVFGVKKSHLKTDLAFSFASVDTCGLLYHSIENFGTIPSKIITKDRFVNRSLKQKIYYNITKTQIVIKKGLFYYSGILFYLSLALFLLYKFYLKKRFFS